MSIFQDDVFLEENVLLRASVALGRHPDNDIVLDDRTLSRFHARLERRGDRYVVVDLGGQNGVYLNGTRVTGEAGVVPGDRIGLGRYVAVFDAGGAPPRRQGAGGEPSEAPDTVSLSAHLHPDNAGGGISIDVDEGLTALGDASDSASDLGDELEADQLGASPAGARRDDPSPSAAEGEGSGAENIHGDDSSDGGEDLGDGFEAVTTTVEERSVPRPALVLLHHGLELSRHEVGEHPMIIGRSKGADIVIGLLGLSRRHARITPRRDGIYLEDLGSQNGTWINNMRIEGSRRLAHGDLLNFYEYALLYVDDPNASVSDSTTGFSEHTDEVSARPHSQFETGVELPSAPRGPNGRSPAPNLAGDPAPHPLSSVQVGSSGLELGEGSFLGDAFDDVDAFDSPLPGQAPAVPPARATEVMDAFIDGSDDDPLEGLAGAAVAGRGVEVDKTTAQERPSDLEVDGGDQVQEEGWPSDEELELALRHPMSDARTSLEVFLDEQLYTQVPLSNVVTRIGIDARCELALPQEVGLSPWHLTLVHFGAATVAYRASARSRVRLGGRPLHQAVLRDGDELQLGRVRIVYSCR